jgi:hypothetical protein
MGGARSPSPRKRGEGTDGLEGLEGGGVRGGKRQSPLTLS